LSAKIDQIVLETCKVLKSPHSREWYHQI